MADWIAGVQREAEEWSHPAQDMRKMSSETERRALDGMPAGNLGMREVARQGQARHQRREVCPL